MSIGSRIEKAMIYRGYNNNSLSKLIGIHASTVKNWITNSTTPDNLKLDILCEKLDISKDWLLSGKGEMLKIGNRGVANTGNISGSIITGDSNIVGDKDAKILLLEREVEHLRELLAEKERFIQALLKK